MFDHRRWQSKFIQQPGYNDAKWVKVDVTPNAEFKCIGVHHLTGAENVGKRNVFIDVVDVNGERVHSKINWTWEGRRPDEAAPPLWSDDKPAYEPGCNISLNPRQNVSVWVNGASDVVRGLTTALEAEEPPGNTWGRHSYYVVFMRGALVPPPTEPPQPPQPPVPTPDIDVGAIYAAAVDISGMLVRMGDVLWSRIIIPLENLGISASGQSDDSHHS